MDNPFLSNATNTATNSQNLFLSNATNTTTNSQNPFLSNATNTTTNSQNPFFSALKTQGMDWPKVMNQETYRPPSNTNKRPEVKPFTSIFMKDIPVSVNIAKNVDNLFTKTIGSNIFGQLKDGGNSDMNIQGTKSGFFEKEDTNNENFQKDTRKSGMIFGKEESLYKEENTLKSNPFLQAVLNKDKNSNVHDNKQNPASNKNIFGSPIKVDNTSRTLFAASSNENFNNAFPSSTIRTSIPSDIEQMFTSKPSNIFDNSNKQMQPFVTNQKETLMSDNASIFGIDMKNKFEQEISKPSVQNLFALNSRNLQVENKTEANVTTQRDKFSHSSSTIQVQNIPKMFYAKEFLIDFFSKFGVIVNINIMNDKNRSAVVKFLTDAAAVEALNNGTVFESGMEPVIIRFYLPDKQEESFQSPKKVVPNKRTGLYEKPSKIRHHSFDDFQTSLDQFALKVSKVCCPDVRSKFDLLDKFDKEIRSGLLRDRNYFKAIQGTCPDMCPEKERYFRQSTNQITYYESNLSSENNEEFSFNEFDARKMLKEYSRSSADQDAPLPHELRSQYVLQMTMDYIVHNILDIALADRPDWFDFVWNRTRAIRKDIIQQNLCCDTSIELIEKCIRFHIFCSHHLCEQDLQYFDTKINLENLTKCIQTLKQMYEDRFKQKGKPSLNEMEFRGYQILMNLNDGDILREVLEFPEVVRKSKPVKFALQVLAAVRDNNYIRFFKFLKLSSFLNSCLMHSYFNQIRANALRLMALTFSVPKADLSYPVADLLRLLAFNDNEDAEDFCIHYGFEKFEDEILFNRSSYTNPTDLFPKRKSKIIMEKCILSLAEIINGKELDELPPYLPSNSFDFNGYYIGTYHKLDQIRDELEESFEKAEIEALSKGYDDKQEIQIDDKDDVIDIVDTEADDDDVDNETDVIDDNDDEDYKQDDDDQSDSEDNRSIGDEKESQIMILREDIHAFSDWFIQNAINETVNEVLIEIYNEFLLNMDLSESIMNQLLAIECINMTRDLAHQIIAEEKTKYRNEETVIEKQAMNDVAKEILQSFTDSYSLSVAQSIISSEEMEVENHVMLESSVEIVNSICECTIHDYIIDISKDTLMIQKSEQKKQLHKKLITFENMKLRKNFEKWKIAFKKHANVRHILEEFPPSASLLSIKQSLKILKPNNRENSFNIHDAYDMLRGGESITQNQIKLLFEKNEKLKLDLGRKISLEKKLETCLCQRVDINSECEINILLKTNNMSSSSLRENKISCQVIIEKLRNTEEQRLLYKTTVGFQRFKESKQTISATINIQEGECVKRNCSGMFYILDERYDNPEDYLSEMIDLPVAVILLTDKDSERIDLPSNNDDFLLIKYVRNRVEDIEVCEDVVTSCICWLVERGVCFPARKTCSMLNFIELCFKKLFFEKLHDFCDTNESTVKIHSLAANDVINFYNEAVVQTTQLVKENLQIDEVDNSIIQTFSTLLSNLQLPILWTLCNEDDWDECYEASCKYVNNLKLQLPVVLLNRINQRLDLMFLSSGQDTDLKSDFPWSQVLELCVSEKLSELHSVKYMHHAEISYVASRITECSQLMNMSMYPVIREQSIYKTFLDKSIEYRQLVKHRKLERKHRLRDVVKDVNMQLNSLEESIHQKRRRRKSSRLSLDKSNESFEDLLNKSKHLIENINKEKEHVFNVSNIKLKQYQSFHKAKTSDKSEGNVTTLETSVLSCLEDIAETRLTMSKSKEYWKSIIQDK